MSNHRLARFSVVVLAAVAFAAASRAAPLPHLTHDRVDSYAVLQGVAAVRPDHPPGTARPDAGTMRILVAALVRNDGTAIDGATRDLVTQLRATSAKDPGLEYFISLAAKLAAGDTSAELARLMHDLDSLKAMKQALRIEMERKSEQMAGCEMSDPCAKEGANTMWGSGAPREALAGQAGLQARRQAALASAMAMLAANVERMHKVAHAVIGNIKP
jgi:hypothetical protein